MPYLSPPTLTSDEQRLILRATAGNPRDHVLFSPGPRHRPAPGRDRRPQRRRRVRAERDATGASAGPRRDREGRQGGGRVPARPAGGEVEAVLEVQGGTWGGARSRRSPVRQPVPEADLPSASPVRVEDVAEASGVRQAVPLSFHPALRPSRTSTGRHGTCSWPSGSRGTCRPSRRRSTRIRATRRWRAGVRRLNC